jgi:hypothetical protein
VITFSVVDFGIQDPEGIVYDPFWNTLVVADRKGRDLYELTPEGGLLRKIDVNFPAGSKISGVTIAPGSTNPALRNYYVTDRRVDNLTNPAEKAVQAQFRSTAGSPSTGCGIGPELATALPVLAWLRRRRRPSPSDSAGQRRLLAP